MSYSRVGKEGTSGSRGACLQILGPAFLHVGKLVVVGAVLVVVARARRVSLLHVAALRPADAELGHEYLALLGLFLGL